MRTTSMQFSTLYSAEAAIRQYRQAGIRVVSAPKRLKTGLWVFIFFTPDETGMRNIRKKDLGEPKTKQSIFNKRQSWKERVWSV